MRTRPASARSSSVCDDWRTPLSTEKASVYDLVLERLETSYSIFSVTLNETFGLSRRGRLQTAMQVLSVSIPLCERLSRSQIACLRGMLTHARHFGVTPNLAPLDPENFHTARAQKVASFNSVFGKILLTRRSQFLTKIEALAELTEDLASGFRDASATLIEGDSVYPDPDWELLDATHYDLNTCLRETVVVLKSFLHALPVQQLSQFRDLVCEQSVVVRLPRRTRDPHLAHRRIAAIKGQ